MVASRPRSSDAIAVHRLATLYFVQAQANGSNASICGKAAAAFLHECVSNLPLPPDRPPLNRLISAIGGIVSDADCRRLAMRDDCD